MRRAATLATVLALAVACSGGSPASREPAGSATTGAPACDGEVAVTDAGVREALGRLLDAGSAGEASEGVEGGVSEEAWAVLRGAAEGLADPEVTVIARREIAGPAQAEAVFSINVITDGSLLRVATWHGIFSGCGGAVRMSASTACAIIVGLSPSSTTCF